MYYVYILKSNKDHKFYLGSTKDLKKRFKDHNDGKVFSTKFRRPLVLAYYETYRSEKEARLREHNLKLRKNAYSQLRRRIVNSLSGLVGG